MDAITVSGLTKQFSLYKKSPGLGGAVKSVFKRTYTPFVAVENVSFTIEAGELVGFIGPNGAGKTTTLKMLSGLLYPTSGKITVLGYAPFERKPEFLKSISLVMGQKNQLWWDLPPMESFLLNKDIYGVPEGKFRQVLDELVDLMDIKDVLNVQVRNLSLGQRMKCELIAQLLHSPRILFLDEPTIGLDVIMQKKLREFIREYNRRYQATVILTSHYMDDVKELCKRVIVIDHGQILFDGRLDDVIKKYSRTKFLSLILNEPVPAERFVNNGKIVSYEGTDVKLEVPRENSNEIASRLLREFPVADLNIEEPPIEEIIRTLFTEKSQNGYS